MDWKDAKTKAGDTTQHLISISSISENGDVVEKVKLFTLNIYIMKKKIMVQGTHREVWLKNEFNLLKKLVDVCVQGKNMAESYFLMTGVKIPVDNNDDLIPSDDEEDPTVRLTSWKLGLNRYHYLQIQMRMRTTLYLRYQIREENLKLQLREGKKFQGSLN